MVIDTNILIAYLNGGEEIITIISDWKSEGRILFISSISVAEVLSLPSLSGDNIDIIKRFLGNFISISFDDAVAESASLLRRNYYLEIADAAIAATALTRNIPLVTRDKQFRKIKELTIIVP